MRRLTVVRNTVFKRFPGQSFFMAARDKASVSAEAELEIEYALRVGQHGLVKLKDPIDPVGRLGYFFLPHVQVSLTELRGAWLTNVDSDVLYSRQNIETGLQNLKALGFTTIYPAVWQRGFTLYPSLVAETFTGSCISPDLHFSNRDMLADLVDAANACGLRIIPWFEYGLAVPANSSLHHRQAKLLTLDQRGEPIRINHLTGRPDFHVWLNPCRLEVQQFMVELIADVVSRYAVDGIQLDDHFCFPVELGYDSFTQELYKSETGRVMPQTISDSQRLKWMTDKMTNLLTQIHHRVKSKSECLISLSPNPLAFSKANYSIDWRSWERQGLIEELVLQVYRDNMTSFINEISKPEVMEAQSHIPTAIGILTGLRTRSVSTSLVEQQIQEVRRRNFAGVSCFFYETLFHEQLSPTKVARNSTDLQRVFVA
jgi:uncharacterized lipoprotein YddW (UPF0748 family)